MTEDDSFWFEAKRYGLGWTLPVTWQGWLVVLIYLVLLVTGLWAIAVPKYRLIYAIAISVLLVAVIVWKGEKPFRWRWGED
jgi:hypothetical protein